MSSRSAVVGDAPAADRLIGTRRAQLHVLVEQPDALYAVGQRTLYRLVSPAGVQWEILGPLPLDPAVNAVQAVAASGGDFWVVGAKGTIVRVNRDRWLQPP